MTDVYPGIWFVCIDQKGRELARCLRQLLDARPVTFETAGMYREAEAALNEWEEFVR